MAKSFIDKGYQRLVGSLLWACRNVFAECTLGVSFLCRRMAYPDLDAWNGAIHMLKWLHQERERGIMFRSTGNYEPVAYSDASNVTDPADRLVQAGFNIQLAGGPIVYQSSKLKHMAPTGATSHVEYMGISMWAQSVIWLRQLLEELQLYDMIEAPTTIFGDNDAANNLVKEDMVSAGNTYFFLSCHWVKGLYEQGDIDVKSKRTNLNIADLFTKPVGSTVVRNLVGKLLGYRDFRDEPEEPPKSASKKK